MKAVSQETRRKISEALKAFHAGRGSTCSKVEKGAALIPLARPSL